MSLCKVPETHLVPRDSTALACTCSVAQFEKRCPHEGNVGLMTPTLVALVLRMYMDVPGNIECYTAARAWEEKRQTQQPHVTAEGALAVIMLLVGKLRRFFLSLAVSVPLQASPMFCIAVAGLRGRPLSVYQQTPWKWSPKGECGTGMQISM